ncbi:MAG: hypothetical protein AAF658_12815 [Myxococcota bacterium]
MRTSRKISGGLLLLMVACTSTATNEQDWPCVPSKNATAPIEDPRSDQELFDDLMQNHYIRIFPFGGRNSGGPQFFEYIYEHLATSHALFERYNRFYCGVSGSIIKPERRNASDVVKVKASDGSCVVGTYHRCCWPCDCDVMKFARAEKVSISLPNDPTGVARDYYLLTIADPCAKCDSSPCPEFPREVTAYRCEAYRTANGLRVKDGRLTREPDGRLVFAMLHDASPASQASVDSRLVAKCMRRINADPAELKRLGGMGNIFVNLALIGDETVYDNSPADLCR